MSECPSRAADRFHAATDDAEAAAIASWYRSNADRIATVAAGLVASLNDYKSPAELVDHAADVVVEITNRGDRPPGDDDRAFDCPDGCDSPIVPIEPRTPGGVWFCGACGGRFTFHRINQKAHE